MSSKDEWARYQEALRANDPKAAAEAFRKWQAARLAEGQKGSKPTFVKLSGRSSGYSVPVEQIPDEMEKDPEFFELMRRIVNREKD